MNERYSPCFECLNRFGKQYSKDCDNTCEYAYSIKLRDSNIEDLNTTIKNLESKLEEEKSRNAKLIARNARLDYDLNYAYQLICKLKGE
jgi:predicted RNase H-like nuclease (RuvC/YqgF family)